MKLSLALILLPSAAAFGNLPVAPDGSTPTACDGHRCSFNVVNGDGQTGDEEMCN